MSGIRVNLQDPNPLGDDLFRQPGHLHGRFLKPCLQPVLDNAHAAGHDKGKECVESSRVAGAEYFHPVLQAFFTDQLLQPVHKVQIAVFTQQDFYQVGIFIYKGVDFIERCV